MNCGKFEFSRFFPIMRDDIAILLKTFLGIVNYGKWMFSSVNFFMFVLLCSRVGASPSFVDNALCGFIASTNIVSFWGEWSCTPSGYTSTSPCSWNDLICDGGGNVVAITIGTLGVSGNCLIGCV